MIKFITEQEIEKQLTFEMVKDDQFFINEEGYFCQKSSDEHYNAIADEYGSPCSMRLVTFPDASIKKILPHVTKIEIE